MQRTKLFQNRVEVDEVNDTFVPKHLYSWEWLYQHQASRRQATGRCGIFLHELFHMVVKISK